MTIQPSVTIWTVLCVAALMLILDRLLFRPLLSFMDKRREKIDGARTAKAEALRQREEEIAARESDRIAAEKRVMAEASAALDAAREENARQLAAKKADNERRLAELDGELKRESEAILAAAEPRTQELAETFARRVSAWRDPASAEQ